MYKNTVADNDKISLKHVQITVTTFVNEIFTMLPTCKTAIATMHRETCYMLSFNEALRILS